MQFWGDDFMASTLGWTAAERGAYLILLWAAWQGDGLPADSERVFRIDPDIRAAWSVLESKFPVAQDGRRRNMRQESERAKAKKFLQDKAAAGRASAAARQQHGNTCSTPVATDEPTEGQHKGNHSLSLSLSLSEAQSLTSETHLLNGAVERDTISNDSETGQQSNRRRAIGTDENFAEFWAAYPRRVGKQAARRVWDKSLKALADWAEIFDDGAPAAMLMAVRYYANHSDTRALEPQFIPHPATWLNRKQFIDYIEQHDAEAMR